MAPELGSLLQASGTLLGFWLALVPLIQVSGMNVDITRALHGFIIGNSLLLSVSVFFLANCCFHILPELYLNIGFYAFLFSILFIFPILVTIAATAQPRGAAAT